MRHSAIDRLVASCATPARISPRKVTDMNKAILTAGLALLISAWFVEPADAWINWKFGVGVNWSHQAGGNNFAWGMFRNGQPPAPTPPGPHGYHPGFMPQGPGYAPSPFAPQHYPAPGFGESAPVQQTPVQTGNIESFPNFHSVSFPGQYIPEHDFSEPMRRK
jgi:hypothetical protein